jgi:hypothetical protein
MIKKAVSAKYSEVEMFRGALTPDLGAKAVMRLERDPTDPLTTKYDQLRNHVRDKRATAEGHAMLDSEGAHPAPGVPPYSIQAVVPLPQMPVVVKLQTISHEETAAPVQPTKKITIAKAETTIDPMMDNMMKVFQSWTFQLSKVNEPRCRGYQTARVYAIQADHPPRHTPIHFLPPNPPTGHAFYQSGTHYQQYLWPGVGPYIYFDKVVHIRRFCPDVHTDQEKGIVQLNDRRSLNIESRGGNGGEISGYRPQRKYLTLQEYGREVAMQGQQRRGVATMAAQQPPQPQHFVKSYLIQRASAHGTACRSGIARQLSAIDRYYSGRSRGTEGMPVPNENCIEWLSDPDEEQEDREDDHSAEEVEVSETEEERDTSLDQEERETRWAFVCNEAGYAFVDERRRRTHQVTRRDDKQVLIEEEIPEV